MADKKNGSLLNMLRNLGTATRSTNAALNGISRDPAQLVGDDIDSYLKEMRDMDKKIVNSEMSRYRISKNKTDAEIKDLYDIIKDSDTLSSIEKMVGSENIALSQLIKDYEIIKRCIPEVHRTITSMVNNILSPDSFTTESIGIEFPSAMKDSERARIKSILDKYELNKKLKNWILDYLIVSTKYISVVPYSEIPNMLEKPSEDKKDKDGKITTARSINEVVDILKKEVDEYPKSLLECSGKVTESLCESITIPASAIFDRTDKTVNVTIQPKEVCDQLNECLSNIEYLTGDQYYKRAILNEAIILSHTVDTSNKEVKKIADNLKKSTDSKNPFTQTFNAASEGYLDDKTIKDIRNNVKFRGCFLEELPAAKVIPFKLRGTIVGYFYVENKYDYLAKNGYDKNLANAMSKINSTVYMNNTNMNDVGNRKAEDVLVKTITDKLIKAVDARFINDNFDDLEIIYNFVKENQLYRDKKRIVFFKSDELFDIRREDGSIMKNSMFLAKLYILLLLNNVITKVTRGQDRNNYFIKQQLTTDVEGSVRRVIRSVKANQVRYSDMNTINQIFNIPGSQVDMFLPVAEDGSRPIELETQAGQDVNMNDDFLQWILKSIVKSFGTASGVIDEYENINFARSISSSNLEYALSILNAQGEIMPVVTDIFRSILRYEIPESQYIDGISLKLTAPSTIIDSMANDKIAAITTIVETIASLLVAPDDETEKLKAMRNFKLEYFKKHVNTLDWDEILEIKRQADLKSSIESDKDQIGINTNPNMMGVPGMGGIPGDEGYGAPGGQY